MIQNTKTGACVRFLSCLYAPVMFKKTHTGIDLNNKHTYRVWSREFLAQTKVCQNNMTSIVEKYVLQFYITVNNPKLQETKQQLY